MKHVRSAVVAAAVAAAIGLASQAAAQTYPSQPVKIIVPTPAGGVADIAGRVLGNHLNQAGKTAVVENRTGGGGAIAASFVAKSPADGYTILVGFHATQAILPHLQKLNYDAAKDLVPVTVAVRAGNVLVINPNTPVKSVKELIDYIKANPGKIAYASQGNGSSGHILGEQFKQLTKLDIAHVPYRGGAPAVQDLVAGHVGMLFDIPTLARPNVDAGKLRALVITTPEPEPAFPGVPTARQAGFPALEGGPWFGFFVPAGTPQPVIGYLYTEAKKAFSTPEAKAQFKKQLLTVMLDPPAETAKFVASEHKRWGDIITAANIKLK